MQRINYIPYLLLAFCARRVTQATQLLTRVQTLSNAFSAVAQWAQNGKGKNGGDLIVGGAKVQRYSQEASFTGPEELTAAVHILETEPNVGSHLFPRQQLFVKLFNTFLSNSFLKSNT